MNEIKISGKVIKKDVFDNELFTRFILEIPTKMKVINDNKIERVNNYISFILFTPLVDFRVKWHKIFFIIRKVFML